MRTTARCLAALMTVALTGFLAPGLSNAQMNATMAAKLIDPDKNASQRAATVEVTTSGVQLVDPALSNEKPVIGQGHLHYQLDKGPIIATPAAKLSFHELTPGAHTITVVLAGNDHKPLGPQQTLNVTIPKGTTSVSSPEGSTPTSKPSEGAPSRKSDY